jgi:hypothetical protein
VSVEQVAGQINALGLPDIDWHDLCPEWAQDDRARIIPRVIPTPFPDEVEHPRDVAARDPELARRIVSRNVWRLTSACRIMHLRGLDGHWAYDVALHFAALVVLRREERIKAALERYCDLVECASA